MALFSVVLKAAIGFSGAWGSCLFVDREIDSDKRGSKTTEFNRELLVVNIRVLMD